MGIGKKLQALREAAGLSQTALAQRAGVSIDSLRNWEQDRVLPRIDAATKLARAMGVSLDALAVDGDEAKPAVAKPAGKRPRKKKG